MIFVHSKSRVFIQPLFILTMTPFANTEHFIFPSPFLANSCQPWVVIFHYDIWATRGRLDIRLTAEVPDYIFTSAVSNSGHVERTSIVFTAVESQLGERQVCSQLIHGGFCENHLITGYSTVWSLDWKLRGWSWTNHNVGNEEPSSWNGKLFFNKEKQPFLKVQVWLREKLTRQQTMSVFSYAEANLYNSLYHTYPYSVIDNYCPDLF